MTIYLDRKDEDILYYFKQGRTNAYQIWRQMNKDTNGKCIVYKNVYARMKQLALLGLLEPIPTPYEINLHSRKDYRITQKAKNEIQKRIIRLMEIIKD